MALWERGDTAPTLFRATDKYKKEKKIPSTSLYTAMTEASWAPLIFRSLMGRLPGRNDDGDGWNFCHFWSNFEIADMDFFRSDEYRGYFDMLDQSGGFYFERVSMIISSCGFWNANTSSGATRPCILSPPRSSSSPTRSTTSRTLATCMITCSIVLRMRLGASSRHLALWGSILIGIRNWIQVLAAAVSAARLLRC